MTPAWCLLALSVALLPGRSPVPDVHRRAAAPEASSAPNGTAARAGAIGLIALGCVAVAGPVIGGAVALVAGPLAARAVRTGRDRSQGGVDRSLPLYLDLAAAALRAGRPLAEAMVVALPATTSATAEPLARVAGLLRLGAEPEQAWSAVARDGPLGVVRATAVRSASSGLRLAAGFERVAADVRAELATGAAARAHRAGVLSMAPLGLCFLPSFVCLGVIPVVVGVARTALGVMP